MADGARGQGAQRGMQNGSNRQRLFLLMRRGHWAGLSWSLAEPADVWLHGAGHRPRGPCLTGPCYSLPSNTTTHLCEVPPVLKP